MTAEANRWFVFVTMTAVMLLGTLSHVRQHRSGAFKGSAWLGKLLVGQQVVTDRRRNPVRFTIVKWHLGVLLVGIWLGWIFLARSMVAGHSRSR